MNIDRNSLNMLLSLNDRQLKSVIDRLIGDSGIDLGEFNISSGDIASIRNTLLSATDEDIANFAKKVEEQKLLKRKGKDGGYGRQH